VAGLDCYEHLAALPLEDIGYDRFADALLDRGWDGTVSVEVLSTALRDVSGWR
jgi:hypothetical protein